MLLKELFFCSPSKLPVMDLGRFYIHILKYQNLKVGKITFGTLWLHSGALCDAHY